ALEPLKLWQFRGTPMLDINFIRNQPDVVRAAIKNKRLDLNLDDLLEADKVRRETIVLVDAKRARKNEIASLIPKASKDDRPKLVEEAKEVKGLLEELEPKLADANLRFNDLMLRVPGIPRPEVPIGKGEEDNVEIRKVGA